MSFDAIVVGLGGVGSAALYQLASRGLSVLGIDRHAPPHPHGSSHGQTRVFRTAYFEHPSYVPLLRRAADLWRESESRAGKTLYHETGLIEIGPSDGVVIPGLLRSASEFELPIETMSMAEAMSRFPGIRGDEAWSVVLERQAGYLEVKTCIESHLTLATQMGATIRTHTTVNDWRIDGDGVELTLGCERIRASRLVLAGGPWATSWLASHGVELSILRKHVYWYSVDAPRYRQDHGFPCYFYETPDGFFYGTPVTGDAGIKVARHSGGETVQQPEPEHQRDAKDQGQCEAFLESYLPSASGRQTHWAGCYYTVTPDEHFVVDCLPNAPQVTVVAGLSGHGFKFTSVLGELAAQTVMGDACELDLEFLRLRRFGSG